MILVLPLVTNSKFFPIEEFHYPFPLIEVSGKPVIQRVVENLTEGCPVSKIIFIIQKRDATQYQLDSVLRLLTKIPIEIIYVSGETQGALCSVLMSIDFINVSEPLMISNIDHLFLDGLSSELEQFLCGRASAGCVSFQSVHPRWAFVRVDCNGRVYEAAEKRPISSNAIAGVYLFKSGSDFIKYAANVIRNSDKYEERYYISKVFNEYILNNEVVQSYPVEADRYVSFYHPQRLKDYEMNLNLGTRHEDI